MDFCLLNDTYAIRIVMMISDKGEICSSDFSKISSNYYGVKASAENL